jgi:hypothetical protein
MLQYPHAPCISRKGDAPACFALPATQIQPSSNAKVNQCNCPSKAKGAPILRLLNYTPLPRKTKGRKQKPKQTTQRSKKPKKNQSGQSKQKLRKKQRKRKKERQKNKKNTKHRQKRRKKKRKKGAK